MNSAIVFDIKRFAIHDGPGIRTTVFFKGCPMTCRWCQNPESQSAKPDILYRPHLCVRCGTCIEACPEGARSMSDDGVSRDPALCTVCGSCVDVCPSGAVEEVGRPLTVEQLMSDIMKDTPFYDQSGGGVTFSGGEPLTQAGFLNDMLDRCGEHDIHRAVDTCGFAEWETVRSVAKRTDLFLFDLKLMDPDRHLEHTGVGNQHILDNLRMLVENGHAIEVRVPVIPTITDTGENIEAIGRFVSALPRPPAIALLPYHATAMAKYTRFRVDKRLPDGLAAPSRKELMEIASRLAGYGLEVKC